MCDAVSEIEWVVGFLFNSVKPFFKTKLSRKCDLYENRRIGGFSVCAGQKGTLPALSFIVDLRNFGVRNLKVSLLSRCYFL